MVPVKDTFGEGWVEMDDDDSQSKENELASLEAIADASGICVGSEIKQEMNIAHEIENNNILKDSSINHVQNICKSKEDNLLVEESLKVSGVDESKFKKLNLSLEEAVLKQIHHLDAKGEQFMKNKGMKSSMFSVEDIATLNETSEDGLRPRRAWVRGREKRNSLLKRVMSEKSFMQGQVMVSKNKCVQEGMSKRGSKEGDKGGDSHINTSEGKREDSEENVGEMERTLQNGSNMEQNGIMEGEEMLFLCIPASSLRNHYIHTSAKESVNPALSPLVMHPKSAASKATFKEVDMHQQGLETIQPNPKKLSEATDVVRTAPPCRALNGAAGMHLEKAEGSRIETQSKTAGRAEKPLKTFGQLSKKKQASMIPLKEKGGARGRMDTLEVTRIGGEEASLQREQGGGRMQANAGVLEEKEVECECCGLGEECTTGYVQHVKEMFSGHWVCGLCAEAVHEERHRLGKGVIPMEEAVRSHMKVCKQFSSMKESGGPPDSPGVAHAVCNLLSRHLSDLTSPRQVATRPVLSRTSSCLPCLAHKPPCPS